VGNFKEDFMKKSLFMGMTVLLAASLIFMACPTDGGDDGDTTAPAYQNVGIDQTKKIVTLTFNEAIVNNTADNAALKAAVTFAADGTNFVALGDDDTVAINGATLVVTFDAALTGTANKIKVAAEALKDAAGNKTAVVTTGAIDASTADTTAPTLLSAARDGTKKIVTLTFSEDIVNATAGDAALKAAVTFAADGTNFSALGGSDTVAISDDTLIVTFNTALTTTTNKIKIAAEALKDAADNKTAEITTDAISAADTVIDIAAIAGVTVPATGDTPVTTITGTAQYTGTVEWAPTVTDTFAATTVYTATITLTPKTTYTLTGVGENFFTVAGATTVTNSADSGVITAVFSATGAGPDTTAPTLTTTEIDGAKKVVTLTFSEDIVNATAGDTELKAAVTFAADGTNFSALGGSDTVAISDDTLVVTFNAALTGTSNKIKVAVEALKDAAGNKAIEITTEAINALSPATAPIEGDGTTTNHVKVESAFGSTAGKTSLTFTWASLTQSGATLEYAIGAASSTPVAGWADIGATTATKSDLAATADQKVYVRVKADTGYNASTAFESTTELKVTQAAPTTGTLAPLTNIVFGGSFADASVVITGVTFDSEASGLTINDSEDSDSGVTATVASSTGAVTFSAATLDAGTGYYFTIPSATLAAAAGYAAPVDVKVTFDVAKATLSEAELNAAAAAGSIALNGITTGAAVATALEALTITADDNEFTATINTNKTDATGITNAAGGALKEGTITLVFDVVAGDNYVLADIASSGLGTLISTIESTITDSTDTSGGDAKVTRGSTTVDLAADTAELTVVITLEFDD
jgi:uncharacterized protein YccT (UPF0319 family)